MFAENIFVMEQKTFVEKSKVCIIPIAVGKYFVIKYLYSLVVTEEEKYEAGYDSDP